MVENQQDPYDNLTRMHLAVIKGWEFFATLHLSTPLAVLEHHGDRVSIGQPKPQYGPDWAGCWAPVTKSLAEILRRPARTPTQSAPELVASPIGLVDSARMVAFLKCYRTIVESPASTADKIALVRQLAADPRFADMVAAFGHDVVDSFAADALRETLGISARIARADRCWPTRCGCCSCCDRRRASGHPRRGEEDPPVASRRHAKSGTQLASRISWRM